MSNTNQLPTMKSDVFLTQTPTGGVCIDGGMKSPWGGSEVSAAQFEKMAELLRKRGWKFARITPAGEVITAKG